MQTDIDDNARVIAPPPLIFLTMVGVGVALGWYWPRATLSLPLAPALGGILILIGLVLGQVCLRHMQAARTSASPYDATTRIICTGPYRYSRNPIYLALALIQIGIGIAAGNPWIIATLPLALIVVRYGVIAREEIYLERKFGDTYRDYTRKVRRWL